MAAGGAIAEIYTLLGFKVDPSGSQKYEAQMQATMTRMKDMGQQLARVSAYAFAGISAGLGLAVKAASDEEAELRRLQTAVEQTGHSWAATGDHLKAFGDEMEKQTRFSHDEYYTAMRMIISITGDVDKAEKGAALAADVATKFHIDLASAAKAVAFAYEGQLRKVNMIIPVLGKMEEADVKLKTGSEKAAFAINLLNEETGGAAAKDMGTYAASIDQLWHQVDRLREAVGVTLLDPLKKVNAELTPMIDNLTKWIEANPKLTLSVSGAAWAGTGLLSVISKLSAGIIGIALTAKIAGVGFGTMAATWTAYMGGMLSYLGVIIALTLAIQDLWAAIEGGPSVVGKVERAARYMTLSVASKYAPKLAAKVLAQNPNYLEGRFPGTSHPEKKSAALSMMDMISGGGAPAAAPSGYGVANWPSWEAPPSKEVMRAYKSDITNHFYIDGAVGPEATAQAVLEAMLRQARNGTLNTSPDSTRTP